MQIDTKDLLNSMLESINRITYVKPGEIPDIDLYMDQVLTFINDRMRPSTRNPEEDKILTKTMINNYAKNELLPPPNKKKYSKEHILMLIFIYYYKGLLSISDIQTLFQSMTGKYFYASKEEFNLEDIYNEVFSQEKEQIGVLQKDIEEKYHQAWKTFEEAPEEDRELLKTFSFICMLSFDVYTKKLLIEKIIDGLKEEPESKK